MTRDHYQINEDGTANVIIFSNWLIAYLRMNGFDFGHCEIKIVKNPYVKDRKELAFVFMNFEMEVGEDGTLEPKDKKFLNLMNEFYNGEGLGGFLTDFRGVYRDTMNLITGKKRMEDSYYAELKLEAEDNDNRTMA